MVSPFSMELYQSEEHFTSGLGGVYLWFRKVENSWVKNVSRTNASSKFYTMSMPRICYALPARWGHAFGKFRRRFRQAVLFYSSAGAQAANAQIASRFS
jgi:hypothetical protein